MMDDLVRLSNDTEMRIKRIEGLLEGAEPTPGGTGGLGDGD